MEKPSTMEKPMRSRPSLRAPDPDFRNNRRQAAIDRLLKIGINPFEAMLLAPGVLQPESLASVEDRYIHEMRTMPRLDIETTWELADMKERVTNLTSRIFEARRPQRTW